MRPGQGLTRIAVTETQVLVTFSCGHLIQWPCTLLTMDSFSPSVRQAIVQARTIDIMQLALQQIAHRDPFANAPEPDERARMALEHVGRCGEGCMVAPSASLPTGVRLHGSVTAAIVWWNKLRHDLNVTPKELTLPERLFCEACVALGLAGAT